MLRKMTVENGFSDGNIGGAVGVASLRILNSLLSSMKSNDEPVNRVNVKG